MKVFFLLVLAVATAAYVRAQKNDGFPVRVEVTGGTLEGSYSTKTGLQTYFGIPFAAPPVGDLRWRAPQPVEPWEGVRKAKQFGPRAVQQYIFDDMRFRSDGVSEDCLYLNVWTPARTTTTGLPILLYFHGGGNVAGSGDELRYDGSELAKRGVMVVTTNYRLGVFGFLAHPELSAEAEYGASGNYGMLDQLAALRWVRDNAEAFGGNPAKITIAGESAGSIGVSMHMTSPLSKDLLAGAVGQSGAAISPTMAPISLAEAEANGEKYLNKTVYESMEALRYAPTQEIYETGFLNNDVPFPTVIDGHFCTEPLVETFAKGEQADVPLLVGWTSAEAAWMPAPESAEAYVADVEAAFPDDHEEALQHYPATTPHRSAVQLASDNFIVYSTWKWFDLHRKNSTSRVFRYRFDRVRPPLVGQTRETEPLGAGHASDIEYFMNSLALADEYAWTEEDRKVAETMVTYLSNFVRSGVISSGGLPTWKAATDSIPLVMHLDVISEQRPSEAEARMRFLDEFMAKGQ